MKNSETNRIRKNITLAKDANMIIQMIAKRDFCSESETISRMARYYAKLEAPEIFEKVRNELDVLEKEKERYE